MASQDEISKKYQKKTTREHLLARPGMYVGSIYNTLEQVWVLDDDNKMQQSNLMYNPGILKLFDEIIMNAADQSMEHPKEVTEIKITVIPEEGRISVYNNGPGIPIVKHKDHDVYIPELVFSQFRTSTNYDDQNQRLKAGLNGFGAKITTTFSKFFQVETVCDNKIYTQNYLNNLQNIEQPCIKKTSSKDYTKVTFFPDMKKFKVNKITDATLKLLERRTYDLAAWTNKNVQVYFNDKKLSIKNFSDYVDLYLPEEQSKEKLVVENDRWKIAICTSPNEEFTQISFVNGVHTMNGGTHVSSIVNPLVKKIIDKYQKKVKETQIKPSFLKNNIMVFIFAFIDKPSFKSQSKEELTTKPSEFGSSFNLEEVDLKKIEKMTMIKRMMEFVKFKEHKALSASDGKKKIKLSGIPKLDDANCAGGKYSQKCTLILTEGDSAKTFATSGLPPKDRDYYGIFPLKGKLLNVRDIAPVKLAKNEEITSLKQILGLQNAKQFKSLDELKETMRYGSILILTDQDVDGSHIKGLLINFFHYFWPFLVTKDNFITCLQTPIVKASKGGKTEIFYNLPDYQRWKNGSNGKWKIKYYKGLGTSSASEAKECFKGLETKKISYNAKEKRDEDAIQLAFQKDLTDERKRWIQENSGKEIYSDTKQKNVPIKTFINKEFVLFSIYDCERSIPNMMDGLKPSQRKVLYGTIKKNTQEEIKVDQLRGYIGEQTAYHHGEKSLNETIISMNHDYVGTNNINLLLPCGQLGTRLMGGKDAASPRYISTQLNPITRLIFKQEDDQLLKYLNDDNFPIEPEYYWPSIPMILVNGSSGIGTGYATDIPPYNPLEIIDNLKKLIDNPVSQITEMTPWFRNFKGTVAKNKQKGNWVSSGVWKRTDRDTIEITELPVGTWTENYKEYLVKLEEDTENNISDIKDFKTDTTVHFVIKAPSLQIDEWIREKKIDKLLKMQTSIKCNFTVFDHQKKIKQFGSAEEILYHFYTIRKDLYKIRYKHLLDKFNKIIKEVKAKVLFIQKIIGGDIKVFRVPKAGVVEQLREQEFPLIQNSYEYLLSLRVYHFTEEQIEKLEKELENTMKVLNEHEQLTWKDLWKRDLILIENEIKKCA